MDEHGYFRSIEERFIRLRGAPLLLSPADYQVARRWWAEGIPLALVHAALEEVFARRAERGAGRTVQSLRYCAPAVEAAWKRAAELSDADRRQRAAPIEIDRRLTELAQAIPESLRGGQHLREEVVALAGSAEEVEAALAGLDRRLLDTAAAGLEPDARAAIDGRVDDSLRRLAGRMTAGERRAARGRLFEQVLRRELGLPVLSLFG